MALSHDDSTINVVWYIIIIIIINRWQGSVLLLVLCMILLLLVTAVCNCLPCAAVITDADKYQFEVTRDRNVSTPAFPVTNLPSSAQQQQHQQLLTGDRKLARTTEVENIPHQLTVQPPHNIMLTGQR